MALSRSARYRRGRRRRKDEEKTQPVKLKIRGRYSRGRAGVRDEQQLAADRASAKRFRKTGPVNEALKPPSEAQQIARDKASASKKRGTTISEDGQTNYSRVPKPPVLPPPTTGPAAKKPAPKKPTKRPVRSNEPSLHTWAKANRKMIERSGTARQKKILKEALKVKQKKSKLKDQDSLFRSPKNVA